jgi:hypothetical protein
MADGVLLNGWMIRWSSPISSSGFAGTKNYDEDTE